YEDLDGDFYAFERLPGSDDYALTSLLNLPGEGGSGLFRVGDLDGDGLPELVTAARREPAVDLESNVDSKFWTLTVWKADASGGYLAYAHQNIAGITIQPGIQNGLSLVDLDLDGRMEILFTPFPRAYWLNLENGILQPGFYREGINSYAVVQGDFDRNGRQDLIVNTENGLIRLEAANAGDAPLAPTGLVARPTGPQRVTLNWTPQSGAQAYRLYRSDAEGDLQRIAEIPFAAYTDSLLIPEAPYTYWVTQVNDSFTIAESPLSLAATATPSQPPLLTAAETVGPRQVQLTFNERMNAAAFDTRNYRLTISGRTPASAIRGRQGEVVLLSFVEEIPAGGDTLSMKNLGDLNGVALGGGTVLVAISASTGGEPFFLESLIFIDKSRINLRFNRPVDRLSAAESGNFSLIPDGEVRRSERDSLDARQVNLFL
ncbi:MAG TPA: hypothetical protein PKV71_21310, partial [Calditrichia bacterium]|nr:hypothetical protein [Calditrichia bacterium]